MGLLDRFRRQPPDQPTALPLRVLRADGQRIDLTARDAGNRLTATRQQWQTDAWDYRDMIGELRYAHRLLARSVARVRFYAAELRDYPDDPAELAGKDHGLDKQLAADAVANLGRLPLDDDPDGFLSSLVENLATPGEGWIHGQPQGRSEETWTVRSVSEITSAGDRIMLAELPTTTSLGQRPIDPEREELLRCWIRHPRWGQLADSPLRSMLDTLEEIVLTGREIRAAARSRIAANGLLLLPESLSLVRTRQSEEDLAEQGVADDEFMADFTQAVTAPIATEGHAGAMVPLVLRGSPEALKEVRHLRLDRADAATLMERLNGAVFRMLRGLDIQPEQVEGVGGLNHWCVDDETEVLSTRGWLRQADLSIGDVVLTLNHVTGASEWQPVQDIYRATVIDQQMIRMEGRLHSSLTTPDHRWPVIRPRYRNGLQYPSREYSITRDLTPYHSIPTGAACSDQPSTPKYTDDLVELMGWFWTEGHTDGRSVSIAQSHTRNANRVERIRSALTRTYGPGVVAGTRAKRPAWRETIQRNDNSHGGPITVFYLNVAASEPLLAAAPAKRVSLGFVRELTPAQLELFIQVSCLGDGWHYSTASRRGQLDIWQRDPDALQGYALALVLSGRAISWGTSAGGYYVTPLSNRVIRPVKAAAECNYGRAKNGLRITEERYTGTIWCPTTSNHTWLARRRGTVYYTGNSGWLVEAANLRHQVEPMAATVAGCLTKAFLRPALEGLDHDPEQVKRVVVWYDVSGLAENPNRGQDARDAHDRLAISDEALRVALGFDDDDKPDDDELQRRIAAKAGIDQATSAIVLDMARQMQNGRPRVIDAQPANALPSGQPKDEARSAQPGETVPEKATPDQPGERAEPNRGMTAAAVPDVPEGWRVDLELARALAGIDTTLAERILTAADAAIARAIERAGGRARNAVRSDGALAASIQGVDAVLVPHTLGRDTLLAAMNLPDLLSDAYSRLREQVTGWLAQSAKQVADAVLRLLGLDRRSTAGRRVHDAVTTRLAVHRDAAWTSLQESLDAAAEAAMFRTDPLTPEPTGRGEETDTLIAPADVARALVIAGGGQPDRPGDGGLGTGPVVRDVFGDEGALLLGWEWQYRPERIRNTYPPHAALDGERFGTWTDPKLETDEKSRWIGGHFRPGDHAGCRCWASPLWGLPEPDDEGIVARRLREAAESEHGRALTRLAAEDIAAGRVGTSARNTVEVRERLRQHYIEGGAG